MKKRKDFLSVAERSERMSKIKSKNTKIEVIVRKELYRLGYRYRIHSKKIKGSPDIVFRKQKVLIFINGDFWHGRRFKEWSHRLNSFWSNKIFMNINRDRKNYRLLRAQGWTVLSFWESQILDDLDKVIFKIEFSINSN